MASRKLLTLEFIKRYYREFGSSPSFGEIAAELNTNRARVSAIVRQLAAEGHVVRTGERRGISLRDRGDQVSESDAVRQLRRMGWVVDEDAMGLRGPRPVVVTNASLPLTPVLDHIADVDIGGDQDDRSGEPG